MNISIASDEKLLLHKLQNGDTLAFKIIYNRYKSLLYFHAQKHLEDRAEIQDIIQDIFSTLWEKRSTIHVSESLTAYLYQSVRNRVINSKLKSKYAGDYVKSFDTFLHSKVSDTDFVVREKLMRELIEREIAALPTKMREVFELSRKEGLSHKEIASLLGLSEQSVRSHIKGALRILRPKLSLIILNILLSDI